MSCNRLSRIALLLTLVLAAGPLAAGTAPPAAGPASGPQLAYRLGFTGLLEDLWNAVRALVLRPGLVTRAPVEDEGGAGVRRCAALKAGPTMDPNGLKVCVPGDDGGLAVLPALVLTASGDLTKAGPTMDPNGHQ